MARVLCSRWLVLAAILLAPALMGTTCGGGDHGGGADHRDQDAIRAVLEEMTQGWTERTVEAIDGKVMPHISSNYAYAGLDHDGYRDNAVEDLENGPDLTIADYTADYQIHVHKNAATAESALTGHGQIADDHMAAPLTGTMAVGSGFTLAKEDGEWKVTAIASRPSHSEFSVGDATTLPTLSDDFAITPTDSTAAGGSFQIAGTLTLPALTPTQHGAAEFALDWDPDAGNVVFHGAGGESALEYDLGDTKGPIDLAAALPADGRPAGIAIPSDLVPGADSVGASFVAWVVDRAGADYQVIGGVMRSFGVPMESFTSGAACDNAPAAGPTGIWRLDLDGGPYAAPQFLDLTLAGTETLSSVGWFQVNELDVPEFPAAPLTGTADAGGFALAFAFDDPNCPGGTATTTMTWTGTFDALAIAGGDLNVSRCDGAQVHDFAFTGAKVTDRCDYVADDGADGQWLVQVSGVPDQTWVLTHDPDQTTRTNYALTGGGVDYRGVLHDNRLYAADFADPTKVVAFVFNDQDTGTFYRLGAEEEVGTFSRLE